MNNSNLKDILLILDKEYINWNSPVKKLMQVRGTSPFFVLLSTIISLRTKDEITIEASKRLFDILPNPQAIKQITILDIQKTIYPCGFYKRKSIQIYLIVNELVDKYNSKVPNNREELLKFHGIGRKTSNLVLTESFNQNYICVDTHVHRISNRIGIIKTTNALDTELQLEKIIPKTYFRKYNYLMVALGQMICKPINPNCIICPIEKYCQKIII